MSTNETTSETETETETTTSNTSTTETHGWTLPNPGYAAGQSPSWPQLLIDAINEIDQTIPTAALTDGDGTERQIWVIANGSSDPADANPEDIIFEEEA